MTRPATARLGPLPAELWTEEERELLRGSLARADRYLSGDPGAPPMPAILGLLARHPSVGGAWLKFSATLLDHGTLDPRDRELLILRIGWRTRCRYEWAQHVGIGQDAGLTAEQVTAVPAGAAAAIWTDRQRDLLRAADQMLDGHVIEDETWERLACCLDERQLLELTFVIGSYACLAMVLNSVGLEPPEGASRPGVPDLTGPGLAAGNLAAGGRAVPDPAAAPGGGHIQ